MPKIDKEKFLIKNQTAKKICFLNFIFQLFYSNFFFFLIVFLDNYNVGYYQLHNNVSLYVSE